MGNQDFQVGGIIVSKKPHACGSNQWIVARTGADIKLKCNGCGKSLFFSKDQLLKMSKEYIQPKE